MLLIRNARLVDPASGTDGKRDLLLSDGRIIKIADRIGAEDITEPGEEGLRILEAEGLAAFPGLVDAHVHFRDPGFTHKEDLETGSRSAAAGGVTRVVLMANTKPCVDQPEVLRYVLEKGEKMPIRVSSCANVTLGMKGKRLTDMEALAKAGAVGFTDDGIPILDEEVARDACREAARLKMPISFHEENPAFIVNNGINHGKASEYFGIEGSDRQAEIDMIARDVRLAEETGACVVIQHISTREGVELVRRAKSRGADVHAEATPHHFTLTEEAAIRYKTMAKMNPPLREEADRRAVIEGLRDGTIDMIATDHAPHSREEKEKPVTQAPSGIIGLETSLALAVTQLAGREGMDLLTLADRMSRTPAALYGLDGGCVREGGPGDLVLFDPDGEWQVESFQSRSANSPFLGWTLKGKIHYTICRGIVVYETKK